MTTTAPTSLRVAAIWGDTILGSDVLRPGDAFKWVDPSWRPPVVPQLLAFASLLFLPARYLMSQLLSGERSARVASIGMRAPDGVPEDILRNVGGGVWELNPRGAVDGMLRLRGREEDVATIARTGAPITLMPGDVALLQYGDFSFFAQPVIPAPTLPGGQRLEPWVVMAFALALIGHGGILYAIRELSSPMPVPRPNELLDDKQIRDELVVLHNPEDPEEKPKAAGQDDGAGAGSGVKDPGIKDKKDQGGGKKIAGTEGKLGQKNGHGDTKLPGDRPGIPAGSLTDVLGSGAGASLSDTLQSMQSVAAITGGLKADDLQWGAGPGFSFKGAGSGGGGKDGEKGVPYGSGTMATGIGIGSGGGGGKGGGGLGGAGKGGTGAGGSGGNGSGSGGTGNGGNGGEKKISALSSGGGSSKGFSADEIRRVVNSHMGQIRACYEAALDSSPGLKGSVTASWHISATGGVPRAVVASSTLSNGRVEGCITRVIKGWTFRNPDAIEADASWGFVFTPPT